MGRTRIKKPLVLRLTLEALNEPFGLQRLLATNLPYLSRSKIKCLCAAFDFRSDEHSFAKRFMEALPQVALFRSHQQAFCGDFIAVDMGPAKKKQRVVYVLELKEKAPLKINHGVGHQCSRSDQAIEAIAKTTRLIGPDNPCVKMLGDSSALLEQLIHVEETGKRSLLTGPAAFA